MKRALKIIALTIGGLVLAAFAESIVGSTHYRLNDVTYVVPHKYEFVRNFDMSWLNNIEGLDEEPEESIWLLIPASELARDIPGYHRRFRGYSSEVDADIVVNVLGGIEAREFPDDYQRMWAKVAEDERQGASRRADAQANWVRIVWLDGEKGTPGEGHSNFYLIPEGGAEQLPNTWLPPSCLGSPDMQGLERYDCSFTIHDQGLTFDFDLRQENIGLAKVIPEYVRKRLGEWRS